MTAKKCFLLGFIIIGMLALPPLRTILLSTMAGHMLIQIPLLAFSGYLLGKGFILKKKDAFIQYNQNGIPGLIVTISVFSFWMLPRTLDTTLTVGWLELAKYISLPLLVGLPLGISIVRWHPITKGFVWANGVSMLGIMSWLYQNLTIRLCNNYLFSQQEIVGRILFLLTITLFTIGLVRLFFSGNKSIDYSAENI